MTIINSEFELQEKIKRSEEDILMWRTSSFKDVYKKYEI